MEKLRLMAAHGFHRLSMGLESTSARLLHAHHRLPANDEQMLDLMEQAHKAGIRKVNIDLMYGLRHQTMASIAADIDAVVRLHPEQVTLYELRTNMLAIAPPHTADWLYEAYSLAYQQLTSSGYHAWFGRNTFSLTAADQGLSSYLRHRMLGGQSYKGFGRSAQSFSSLGVSYNQGKNCQGHLASGGNEQHGDVYLLPPRELCAKYIAIAAYGGQFSLSRASQLLHDDARSVFRKQLDFCLSEGLLFQPDEDILRITPMGFRHYGAVFSLFYPQADTE